MRPMTSDPLQGFRYHVVAQREATAGGGDPLQPPAVKDRAAQAGFTSVTVPEISVEAVEYREGTFKYTEKYPGVPTVSDITLMRGITLRDTAFHQMVIDSVEGRSYRYTVTIYHYHRAEMDTVASGFEESARKIICYNAFATRAKSGGDLDSTAGDISMSEVDLAMESFDIETGDLGALSGSVSKRG